MEIIFCNLHLFCTVLLIFAGVNIFVHGSCPKSERTLWANTNPSSEEFTDKYLKYLSSDRGEKCRWIIKTSTEDTVIKLSFTNFELKNSTETDKGDCLTIYDGASEENTELDELCDKPPQKEYTSTEGKIMVVYRRGKVVGSRQFTMVYSAHSDSSSDRLIQIAGIVGAILAALGLGYVVLRVTKCCKCLRHKSDLDNNRSGSTTRDRLVMHGEAGGDILDTAPDRSPVGVASSNHPLVQLPNNGLAASATNLPVSQAAHDGNEEHDSDLDSLRDMNELPPSYESLYLNEQGETVAPPEYSPPLHKKAHPPRRVNTVN